MSTPTIPISTPVPTGAPPTGTTPSASSPSAGPTGPVGSPPAPPTQPAAHTAGSVGDSEPDEKPHGFMRAVPHIGWYIWPIVVMAAEFVALTASAFVGAYKYDGPLITTIVLANIALMVHPFVQALRKRQHAGWHRAVRLSIIGLSILFTLFVLHGLILASGDGVGSDHYASQLWGVGRLRIFLLIASLLLPAIAASLLTWYDDNDETELEADRASLAGLEQNMLTAKSDQQNALLLHSAAETVESQVKAEHATAAEAQSEANDELKEAQEAYDTFDAVITLKEKEDLLKENKSKREALVETVADQKRLVREAAEGPERVEREGAYAKLEAELGELQTEGAGLETDIEDLKSTIEGDSEQRQQKLEAAKTASEEAGKVAAEVQQRLTNATEKLTGTPSDPTTGTQNALAIAAEHLRTSTEAYEGAKSRIEQARLGFKNAWRDFLVRPVTAAVLLFGSYTFVSVIWYGKVLVEGPL